MGYSTSSGVEMGGRDMFPSICIKCADEHLKDCLETVSVSFNRGAVAERMIEGDLLPPPLLMEPIHTPDVEPIVLRFSSMHCSVKLLYCVRGSKESNIASIGHDTTAYRSCS